MAIISQLTEEKAIATLIIGHSNKTINIIEKAEAIQFLYNIYEDAEKVSKKSLIEITAIHRYLRIASLPNTIKQMALKNELTSYHVLAELTRLQDPKLMEKVAEGIRGIPREIAREIIRYILKNPEKKVKESVQYVIDSYGEQFELCVYFIPKQKRQNVFLELDPIQVQYYVNRTHVNEQDEFYLVVLKNEEVERIKSDGFDVKDFLRTVVENV